MSEQVERIVFPQNPTGRLKGIILILFPLFATAVVLSNHGVSGQLAAMALITFVMGFFGLKMMFGDVGCSISSSRKELYFWWSLFSYEAVSSSHSINEYDQVKIKSISRTSRRKQNGRSVSSTYYVHSVRLAAKDDNSKFVEVFCTHEKNHHEAKEIADKLAYILKMDVVSEV